MEELKLDLGWFWMYFRTLVGQLETMNDASDSSERTEQQLAS